MLHSIHPKSEVNVLGKSTENSQAHMQLLHTLLL